MSLVAGQRGNFLSFGLPQRQGALGREAEHRMANSLQIIAAMMRQSAKFAASEEARHEIASAQQRVMAIASLHRLLMETGGGNVAMDIYLQDLARGIGASLLRERGTVTIETRCDPCRIGAGTATSLGLVVTELAINAIKHAFPEDAGGKVRITFRQWRRGWLLSVSDDGVGPRFGAKPGLGGSILAALASQLDARLTVRNRHPGTRAMLVHFNPAPRSAPSRAGG